MSRMSGRTGRADAARRMPRSWRVGAALAAIAALGGCSGVSTYAPDTTSEELYRISRRLKSIEDANERLGLKLDDLESLLAQQPKTKAGGGVTGAASRPAKSDQASVILRPKIKADPFCLRVQRALKAADYDPGPEDGKKGRRTTAALKSFQRDNNLPETGKADEETLALLKRFFD